MSTQEIKIPKERIAVLIGEKGSTKRQIQNRTKSTIKVNSEEGDIQIGGEDGYLVLLALNIVKAVGRGFNPEIALNLAKDDYVLEIINIHDFSGNSKKKEERLKARVIGTEGKARRTIERLTNTNISIYGKTISVIGLVEGAFSAKKAIEKLLAGSKHSTIYRILEKEKKNTAGF